MGRGELDPAGDLLSHLWSEGIREESVELQVVFRDPLAGGDAPPVSFGHRGGYLEVQFEVVTYRFCQLFPFPFDVLLVLVRVQRDLFLPDAGALLGVPRVAEHVRHEHRRQRPCCPSRRGLDGRHFVCAPSVRVKSGDVDGKAQAALGIMGCD